MTAYDDVPYESQAFYSSSPEHLGTLGKLHGLETASTQHCSFLEVGCGDGANLLAVAAIYPHVRCVGLDYAETALAAVRRGAAEFGLSNVETIRADLTAFDPAEIGQFDYIAANGVYSWIPPQAQEGFLALYGQCLAPHGVGYISHNTLPGWYLRRAVRELSQMHTVGIDTAQERIEQTQNLLQAIHSGTSMQPAGWKEAIEGELEHAMNRPRWFTHHDLLAPHNSAVYIAQLAQMMREQGLQFLADASTRMSSGEDLGPSARAVLESLEDDWVRREQYVDFFRGRVYRQTLVCRAEHRLERKFRPERLMEFSVRANLKAVSPYSRQEGVETTFKNEASGLATTVTSKASKLALELASSAWPSAVPFPAIIAQVQKFSEALPSALVGQIGADFLSAFAGGVIEISQGSLELPRGVSERPRAFPLARRQAEYRSDVTSLLLRKVQPDEYSLRILRWLDGTRTFADLVELVQECPLPKTMLHHSEAVKASVESLFAAGLIVE